MEVERKSAVGGDGITSPPTASVPVDLHEPPVATGRRVDEQRRSQFEPFRKPRSALVHSRWTPYLYLAPGLLLFGALILFPVGRALWVSLLKWDGISPPQFVGFQNYVALFSDPTIVASFRHALVLIVFYSALPILFGLILAAILGTDRMRGSSVMRTILFFPYVLPLVVVAVTWKWIYSPQGPLNAALSSIGLGGITRAWLGDFTLALPSVGLVGTWVLFGFAMVLFVAGVQKIPQDLYDAARVDGSGPFRSFVHVTLPGLRNELLVVAVVTVIAALRTFDVIYVTTRGGPGRSTTVPSLEVFRRAFERSDVGQATAIGLVLAVLVFLVALVVIVLFRRATDDQ